MNINKKIVPNLEIDEHFVNPQKITFIIPNKDTFLGPYTYCPADVLLKSYTNTVGKTIEYLGEIKKVVSVKVTEKEIIVELE